MDDGDITVVGIPLPVVPCIDRDGGRLTLLRQIVQNFFASLPFPATSTVLLIFVYLSGSHSFSGWPSHTPGSRKSKWRHR